MLAVAPAATATAQGKLSVSSSTSYACAGQRFTLTAKQGDTPDSNTSWTSSPPTAGDLMPNRGSNVAFTIPDSDGTVAVFGTVAIKATDGANTDSVVVTLGGFCRSAFGGEVRRATLGYEQIGASGLDGAQKFSFDFFITRPLPFALPGFGSGGASPPDHYLGPPLRWWGDVRVASYPQTIDSAAAPFASGFATSAGKVKLNQLAQSAEFTTGLEVRVPGLPAVLTGGDGDRARFALMGFGGVGAVGPFPPVAADTTVYAVPDSVANDSLGQLQQFRRKYPGVATKYVAFRTTTPDRFLSHWEAGLRLYSFYADKSATGEPLQSSPAMVSFAVGQNREISPIGDKVFHASAYYPFALGDRTDPNTLVIYLFGEAWSTWHRAHFNAPDFQLAANPKDTANKPIPITDSRVTILSVDAVPRDTYRIGVSIDLIKVWNRLTTPPSGGGAPTTAKPIATAGGHQ